MTQLCLSLAHRVPPDSLADGIYWYQGTHTAGGFCVYRGKVISCAPRLRHQFSYFLQSAILVSPIPERYYKSWRLRCLLTASAGLPR